MRARLEQLQRLCHVTSWLAEEINYSNWHKVVQGAASLFKGSKALVCLADNKGSACHAVASHALTPKFIKKFSHLAHEDCPCGFVRTKKHPFYLSIVSDEKEPTRRKIQSLIKEEGMGAMLGVPIQKDNSENIGCISFFFNWNFTPGNFDIKILEIFTKEVALAVNSAQLYRKTQGSEELYKELYGQAPCMYYSVDERGNVLKCNNAGAQCLGYERGELIGKSFSDFLDKESVVRFRALLDGALKGSLSEDELGLVTKEGNTLHTIASATQASFAGQREVRIVLIDITEKKKLCEKLGRAEKLVELIAGIAHDFNNFLTIIRGNAHLMEEKVIGNKELKECLNIIKKAAMDGAETVKRMREFTNIRDDTAKFVPLNLNHIIKEILDYTKSRWKTLARANGVTYKIKFIKTTGGGWVMGNPSELKEVFLNVINNALDAMPKGGNLDIETQRKGEDIIVSVKDIGVGMPEEVQKRVFDPFFTTKGEEGSGLGMSVAYGIIAKHRGGIEIQSQKGKGTKVMVKLPATRRGLLQKNPWGDNKRLIPGEKDLPRVSSRGGL